jgi:hypothetical protein
VRASNRGCMQQQQQQQQQQARGHNIWTSCR